MWLQHVLYQTAKYVFLKKKVCINEIGIGRQNDVSRSLKNFPESNISCLYYILS